MTASYCFGSSGALQVRISMHGAKNGTDLRNWSVPIFALPAATFSRPDPVQEHYGMTKEGVCMSSLG